MLGFWIHHHPSGRRVWLIGVVTAAKAPALGAGNRDTVIESRSRDDVDRRYVCCSRPSLANSDGVREVVARSRVVSARRRSGSSVDNPCSTGHRHSSPVDTPAPERCRPNRPRYHRKHRRSRCRSSGRPLCERITGIGCSHAADGVPPLQFRICSGYMLLPVCIPVGIPVAPPLTPAVVFCGVAYPSLKQSTAFAWWLLVALRRESGRLVADLSSYRRSAIRHIRKPVRWPGTRRPDQ